MLIYSISALVYSAKKCLFLEATKYQVQLISVVFGSVVGVKFVTNSFVSNKFLWNKKRCGSTAGKLNIKY